MPPPIAVESLFKWNSDDIWRRLVGVLVSFEEFDKIVATASSTSVIRSRGVESLVCRSGTWQRPESLAFRR